MTDTIKIDDRVRLTQAQWAIVWRHVSDLFGATQTPPAAALTLGKVPESLQHAAAGIAGAIRIEPHWDSKVDGRVSVCLEEAARDLLDGYRQRLQHGPFTLLAQDATDDDTGGSSESYSLYATPSYSIVLHDSVPSYSDNEDDAVVVLYFTFGSEADRTEFNRAWIHTINADIIERISSLDDAPVPQLIEARSAVAKLLADIDAKVSASVATTAGA